MAVVFQHHAAGARHGPGVHHHIAGDDQAGAALGPGLVEPQQVGRGRVVRIGHVLLHGRLGDAVGNEAAVGQGQGWNSGMAMGADQVRER
jgi:hypothetical protein